MRFSKVQSLRVQGCYAVGWSDLHFLRLSKIGTRRAHTAPCAYFPFQKITGTLKLIFLSKFAETFLLHQRTIVKEKIQN